ncbi:Baculoviral IAP repeat-containing protein 2 [Armadillidium vulgare]|nr:Baculoviral IAP repeat-containing protein 2 [Armadillidium vulgare]
MKSRSATKSRSQSQNVVGLSDHVRCFHCGKGLRNWEPDDDPWVEHARWFPDCHFVLLKKGVEYVDKVRRENPPYIPVRNRPLLNAASATASSSPKPLTLNDDEMDKLMELQIMKHVLDMGFAPHVVVKALRKKLMESGQPFFSVEACIDAVLLILEEETKNTIHGCEDITAQVRKMAAIESSNTSNLNTSSRSETLSRGSAPSSGITLPTLPARQENVASNVSVSSLPPLPNNNFTTTTSTVSIPPILNISRASPPLRSSTPTSHLEQANSQSMITETEPETAEGSPSPITLNDSNNDVTTVENTSHTENAIGNSAAVSSNSENLSKNLAMELQRIKENMMCKVCMDKEMDVVFLPCTHMVTCSSCAVALASCPICRRDIQYAFKPIIS